MSTTNLTETEIKIPVQHMETSAVLQMMAANGLIVSVPRLFEANSVYDTVDQKIRGAQMLLRLRQVGGQNILTWKGPSVAGPHKSRPEIETRFDSFQALDQILRHLGYEVYFRYEKYRTEFADSARSGTVTFDETPIGNFLELEGDGPWIDQTALQLGFKKSDYVLESYGKLYQAYCGRLGLEPADMTFASYTK